MDEKMKSTVERHEIAEVEIGVVRKPATMGTVTINDTQELILVPTPSADPRGDTLVLPYQNDSKLKLIRSAEHAEVAEGPFCCAGLYLYDP
jgi:hypothetical protein